MIVCFIKLRQQKEGGNNHASNNKPEQYTGEHSRKQHGAATDGGGDHAAQPREGVCVASADVKIGGFMTIRNVRIKEDDYGLTVSMPRTKMPQTDQYKDSVYFADRSMKEQFDQIILNAYQNSILSPVLNDDMPEEEIEQGECMDQEEAPGMSMVM